MFALWIELLLLNVEVFLIGSWPSLAHLGPRSGIGEG